MPLLELAPPATREPLDAAVARIEGYDWFAFTSANAVQALSDALARADRALPPGARLASVGPSTSRSVRELLRSRAGAGAALATSGPRACCAPSTPFDLTGQRVLLPVSDRARDVLAEGLRAREAQVDVVVAYRTVTPTGWERPSSEALRAAPTS